MKKIPTLFVRDPATQLRYLTREVNPAAQWVVDGEGTATRKYDGTCVMFDGAAWFARREVKPDKTPPPNFVAVETDETTGKTVGWEPIEQSAFAKWFDEALAGVLLLVDEHHIRVPQAGGTYELVGPKVNGNPENVTSHMLVRHGYTAAVDGREMRSLPLDYDGLADWLQAHSDWEGIVWHHPDGRMAKIKRKDFPA